MNETQLIEAYLLDRLSAGDRTVFEAKLLIDAGLAERTQQQRQVYAAVMADARKQLRAEIAAVDNTLFTETRYAGFRRKIQRLFNQH